MSVEEFLKRLGVKEHLGDVVDTSGNIIGKHRGVVFYTIGQRHGFEIFGKTGGGNRAPLYVIRKDAGCNHLVVGFGAETYSSQFNCGQLNWLVDDKWLMDNLPIIHHPSSIKCFVRIRHGGELILCRLVARSAKPEANFKLPATCNVLLNEPQRGIAPGQSAVFYLEDGTVLGGGVIQ